MASVWIPAVLRDLVGGRETVRAPGDSVGAVIDAVDGLYPGFKTRLCPSGQLEPWIMVSVDGAAAELGLAEPVGPESEILFVAAVSGGASRAAYSHLSINCQTR